MLCVGQRKTFDSCAKNGIFFVPVCGKCGAKVARQLKVFWGDQIGSWVREAPGPLPTENVRLGVKLLIRLRTQ